MCILTCWRRYSPESSRPSCARVLSATQRSLRSRVLPGKLAHSILAMEVILYSAFWCADCRLAKRFLREHNVAFKEIDIETTPGAAEEVVRQTGKRAIPQLVINGEWFQPYRLGEGLLYEEMAERLGIDF